MNEPHITLKGLIQRFWKKAALTWLLVFVEGAALLLMPLVIGWAIDDLIQAKLLGIVELGILCLLLLIVGAGRRFYDTRVYSRIYEKVSHELVEREKRRRTSVSKISARTNLFTEFIEFLENALPDIVNQFIGLAGTLVVIAIIDQRVFWACLAGAVLTATIYIFSQKKIHSLNKGQNDEFERQVDVLSAHGRDEVRAHFKELMRWNIRLSDLETVNFSFTWLALAGVLIYAIVSVASSPSATFGQVVSIVMYVFGFMESVMTFPLYYQQVVRLHDIAERLG